MNVFRHPTMSVHHFKILQHQQLVNALLIKLERWKNLSYWCVTHVSVFWVALLFALLRLIIFWKEVSSPHVQYKVVRSCRSAVRTINTLFLAVVQSVLELFRFQHA
jgi:hypothetical protein